MEIFWTVISVAAISVGLTVIIIISEHFLNNYGECQIDINQGKRLVKVKGGSSLLNALASQKIYIPSACGGKATCGLCKVIVEDGAGPLLPTELPYLTAEEIAQKKRLSCQIKVKRNMRVQIPEALFNIREFSAKVASIEQLTHDIKNLHLELIDPPQINFQAGQYLQLYSKPFGKIKESVFRAYSIASVPSENAAVDLIVRLVPQGICTTYVHTVLKTGDTVKLSGPYGDFTLRGQADNLVFIAGGSGLAPIRSIILDSLEKGRDKQMTFFFGAVTRKDLYYVDFFQDLAGRHANFQFIPALSKPDPADQWTGETGLITEVVSRHVPDAVNREAYLCGSPGMINACLDVLKKKGFTDQIIFFDKF